MEHDLHGKPLEYYVSIANVAAAAALFRCAVSAGNIQQGKRVLAQGDRVIESGTAGLTPRSTIYRWYVVLFLTAAATVSYVDRQILALMVGPVKRDLGISDTQIGLLVGLAFSIFYCAMIIPMAWLADTRSRRTVVGAGIFSWSMFTSLSGLAQNYTQLFMARMVVGVGEATLSPAAYSLLSDYFSRDRLPFAVGVFAAAPFIGIGLANIVGGSVIEYLESLPPVALPLLGLVRSWQFTFLLIGLPGIALSCLIFTVREPVRRGRIDAAGNGRAAVSLRSIAVFLRQRWQFFLLHFGGFVLFAILGWMFIAWVAEFFIRKHGMAPGEIGTAYGIIALTAGLGGSIAGGRLATAMLRRETPDATLRLCMIGALLMAPVAICMPLLEDQRLALLLLIPLTFFMAWPPGLGIAALQAITPNEIRGRIIALYLVATNFLSFTLGPLLVGVFNDHVFHSEAAIGTTLATVSGFGYPLAALSLFLCLKHFRSALQVSRAWE